MLQAEGTAQRSGAEQQRGPHINAPNLAKRPGDPIPLKQYLIYFSDTDFKEKYILRSCQTAPEHRLCDFSPNQGPGLLKLPFLLKRQVSTHILAATRKKNRVGSGNARSPSRIQILSLTSLSPGPSKVEAGLPVPSPLVGHQPCMPQTPLAPARLCRRPYGRSRSIFTPYQR